MFNYVGYTCRLHSCDMFDEMPVMASRDLLDFLLNIFLLHHCFPVILLILIHHSIVGNALGSRPKKVA